MHLPPPEHGAARVGMMIKEAALLKPDFELSFLRIAGSRKVGQIGRFGLGVGIIKLIDGAWLILKSFFAMARQRPATVYYTPGVGSFAFYRDCICISAAKICSHVIGTKLLLHFHSRGIGQFAARGRFNQVLVRWFLNGANVIVMSSMLKGEFDGMVKPSQLRVLPNGVVDPFKNCPEAWERSLAARQNSLASGPFRILFLSHLMPFKGYRDLLASLRILLKDSIQIEALFAGSWGHSSDKTYFESFVAEHNLSGSVRYVGFADEAKKYSLLSNAHIVVLPSHNEAFPLVLLEALSFGVPVIGSMVGAIPEIITKEVGLLTAPHDEKDLAEAIRAFIGLPKSAYGDMCRAARHRYISQYSQALFNERFASIVRGLILTTPAANR